MTVKPSVSYHWEARFLDRDGHEVGGLAAETLPQLADALRAHEERYSQVILWLIRSRGNMVEGVIDQDMASLTSDGLPVFFGGSSVKRVPEMHHIAARLNGAAVVEAARGLVRAKG